VAELRANLFYENLKVDNKHIIPEKIHACKGKTVIENCWVDVSN
jgi:hypothetical protein